MDRKGAACAGAILFKMWTAQRRGPTVRRQPYGRAAKRRAASFNHLVGAQPN
jgi:hypothetical protein